VGTIVMVCPVCKARNCRRSRRRNLFEYGLSFTGILPWRCPTCETRFRAHRVAFRLMLRAHCPRCGNPHLDKIASDRVVDGLLLPLKRILGLPAYRCDPCRMKFYSIMPRYHTAHPR